jgi:hypothetical protein
VPTRVSRAGGWVTSRWVCRVRAAAVTSRRVCHVSVRSRTLGVPEGQIGRTRAPRVQNRPETLRELTSTKPVPPRSGCRKKDGPPRPSAPAQLATANSHALPPSPGARAQLTQRAPDKTGPIRALPTSARYTTSPANSACARPDRTHPSSSHPPPDTQRARPGGGWTPGAGLARRLKVVVTTCRYPQVTPSSAQNSRGVGKISRDWKEKTWPPAASPDQLPCGVALDPHPAPRRGRSVGR